MQYIQRLNKEIMFTIKSMKINVINVIQNFGWLGTSFKNLEDAKPQLANSCIYLTS